MEKRHALISLSGYAVYLLSTTIIICLDKLSSDPKGLSPLRYLCDWTGSTDGTKPFSFRAVLS